MPDAAVAIVNFRSTGDTLRCAAAARRDAAVSRVVVIDNASGDGSVQALREAGLEVVAREDNGGFAVGVNAAFAATDEAFVVVLNPDTEPPPGAIDALVAHLRARPEVGMAAPRLVYPDGAPQPSTYRRFPNALTVFADLCVPLGYAMDALGAHRHPLLAAPDDRAPAHVTGAVMAIRRAAYTAAGGFDEGFFLYFEETEWQGRVRAAGWDIAYLPEVQVVHHVRGGGDAALAPSVHFARSAIRYLGLRGSPAWLASAAVRGGILSSRAGLRLIALAVPAKREISMRKARAYDALWRYLRDERGRSPRRGDGGPSAAA